MKQVHASAPGKLVLLGEYAVLEGAPALVLAVDRRANARLLERADGVCAVHAPDLGIVDARLQVRDQRLHWLCDADTAARLSLVDHVWHGLAEEGLAPEAGSGFDLHLDTSGFFHRDSAVPAKLGLGSSAALTVALGAALVSAAGHAALLNDRPQWLRRLLHMHTRWQGGRGSGLDLGASIAGGLIRYQLALPQRDPSYISQLLPMQGVHCLFVWSGQSVSTHDFLHRLEAWRVQRADDYRALMNELGSLSDAAIAALGAGEGVRFIELTRAYAQVLSQFAHACGLEIYSPAQQQLSRMASAAGVSYKPCGAGGDFGVVFCEDAERLATFERAIVPAGMHVVALQPDALGLASDVRQA